MEKKEGFILYFDILGYCSLMQLSSLNETQQISSILESYTRFYNESNFRLVFGDKFKQSKFFKRFFSDNFLLLYESSFDDYETFKLVQCVATMTQRQFLEVGLLTKGSITFGEIYYNDDIVFGLSIVKAVKLESSHKNPSIVIDQSIIDNFKKCKLDTEVKLFDYWPDSKPDFESCVKGIKKCVANANKEYAPPDVIDKIKWVVEQLNNYFGNEQKIKYEFKVDYKYYLEEMIHEK